MSDHDPALIEKAATAAYYMSPARTPWGGDDMAFDAPHWAAKDDTEKARKVARAVLDAVADDLRADAWDEGWYVRCHVLSAKNPYSGRHVDEKRHMPAIDRKEADRD